MVNKFLPIMTAALALLAISATPAWAVQSHGGAEGLVSHQIGHLLFTLGMGYMLFRLRSMRVTGSGWTEFKVFTWLIIAWNILTFSGHWMDEFVAPAKFVRDHANTLYFTVGNFSDALYYLTRLDHLLLVPSFACLLLALRRWSMPQ